MASYFSRLSSLHESLHTNNGDLIAKHISELLECPVDFVSRAGKVLVSVNNTENGKNRFVKNQYVPGMNKLRDYPSDTVFFNPLHSNKLVPLDSADKEQQGNFIFPVLSDTISPVLIGYMILEGMSMKQISFLTPVTDYICKALSITFLGYERNEYRNATRYTALIRQLLNGDLDDDAQIKRMANEVFPVKTSPLRLIVVQCKRTSDGASYSDSVISEVFPLGANFKYNSVSAVLVPGDDDSLSPKHLDQFRMSLEKYDCTAGISEPIPQIDANFKNFFQRTLAAAITANMLENNEKKYMFYKEAALGHMAVNLTEVPHLSGIRKSLVDVNLLKMIDIDSRKNSDYFRTLQAYWHFNHDTAKICDYLHLSKSTLFYKLNKIKELLDQDINDYESVLQLSLGIAILESMGLVRRDIYPDK